MIRRLITALAVWGCGIAALHAADVVTVSDVEGNVGHQVELSVNLITDTPDIVAAEIHIPLPEQITAVAGSCKKSDSRLPDHSVSADMRNGELVAVIFNTSLKPIPVGAGEAFSISLDLGENPGDFTLTPYARLSNASGQAVSCTSESGTLTVKGARLELGETDVDFGRVPIHDTYTWEVTATNTGTAALLISDITTDVPGLTVEATEKSVAPGEGTTLLMTYAPTQRSKQIAGRFTVISNSVGRAPFVRVTSVPFSVNEIHVGDAEGISDEEVTVSVTMNNMEPITGAEMTFTLPEELEYVEGSLVPSARASKLSTASNFGSDRKLRLILYNAGNVAVNGDDGELLTFKLKLTGRSGRYELNPERVILSNAAGENMVSATTSGYITISSPSLSASSRFDIGNVPLSGTDTFDYSVSNSSNVPLTIEKVAFLSDIAECKATFPIIVESNSDAIIPVTIVSPRFGDFSTVMNLYSNDPDNRLKSVDVSGSFYSANELSVSGALKGESYVVTASLTNEADIVALQLDILMPDGISLSSSDLTLLDRAASHSATLASVGKNLYRVIIFSLNNTPFTGNSGGVFTLSIPTENIEGKQIRFEKIKLSSSTGINYTNPNAEILINTIPVFLKAITLSETELALNPGDAVHLIVTLNPEDADNVQLLWSSSDETVATVDAEGNVTAFSVGEAIIRVADADNTEIFAECKVTVEKALVPLESITLSETELTLNPGDSAQLTVTLNPEDADNVQLIWSTSDEDVVKVDEEGNVTAVGVGEAIVRVADASQPEIFAECLVKVDIETGVEIIAESNYAIRIKENLIFISDLTNSSEIALYSIDGTLIWHEICDDSSSKINVSLHGVYLLVINGIKYKVLVK